MTPGEWERRIKAAEAAARTRRRAMVFIDDPEENLAEYRLPDWVADKLPTIGLGRSSGLGGEPESTTAWIERLTREAAGEG
jgi:hypothetical protein